MKNSSRNVDYQGTSPLEYFFIEQRLLGNDQLSLVQDFMSESHVNAGTAAMFLKLLDEKNLGNLLERKKGIQFIDAKDISVPLPVRKLMPAERAISLEIFPLNMVQDSGQTILLVAMTDPLNNSNISKVENYVRMKVQPVFVGLNTLQVLYKKYYKTGLKLYPPEITSLNRTTKSKVKAMAPVPTHEVREMKVTEPVQALISLLIKKGVFTLQEYQQELEKVCS